MSMKIKTYKETILGCIVKNCMRQIYCLIVLTVMISLAPSYAVLAGERDMDLQKTADEVVLTAGVGSSAGELGYSDTMMGGGSGPEAFTVTRDGKIYICDNVNQRVNVYEDGKFIYEIETPYISYVRSMVVSQGLVYLMDYDGGIIYKIDADGKTKKKITLPKGMKKNQMKNLYVRYDGSVWLMSYHEKGVSYSYFVNDLENGKTDRMKGYTKDGASFYSIAGDSLNVSYSGVRRQGNCYVCNFTKIIPLVTDARLASMNILNVDKNGAVYVDIYEMEDSSIVTGAYTVKQYINGKCKKITSVDLKSYYFMPNRVICVSEEGDLYQMICRKDNITIIKKV